MAQSRKWEEIESGRQPYGGHMSDEQAQEVYDRISGTWRLQTSTQKRDMIADLRGLGGSGLAGNVAKLIDEIETELRLEELDDPPTER